MKLINLIVQFVAIVLNVAYYIIASPVLIPLHTYRWRKNSKWRKNVKKGDRCFFINMMGTKSFGTIYSVSEDGKSAGVQRSGSSGWHDIKNLRII